jgi:hypothetical protein
MEVIVSASVEHALSFDLGDSVEDGYRVAVSFKCARHGQQLGGGSPLHNLMEVKC